ncbi:MAG: substrate-binding domain-containing protein [Rubrivivax sp.]
MSTRLTGISSMATKGLLADLVALYRAHADVQVGFESVGGVDAARRVEDGEAFDLVVLADDAIDKLVSLGVAQARTKTPLAHSSVAVAVRAGTTRPDIGTPAALREAVLHARSVGYSTGPSGVALVRLFERWGIIAQLGDRLVQAPPGVPVASLVARGDVDLGFQQLSELMHAEGIDVLGPLPEGVQVSTTFCAACCSTSRQAVAATSFLEFLRSPATEAAKRQHGMVPA